MNPIINLIKNHRSIRRFKDKPISQETVEAIISAGQSASTSNYIQACSVIQINKPELRQAFVELSGQQKYIASASVFLVFCADLNRQWQASKTAEQKYDFSWTEQFLAATIDVALFSQNSVIAAESLDLGCCYIGGIRNDPEQVIELLDLPDLVYPLFGLCIGFPDQDPQSKPRLPGSIVLHQDTYQPVAEQADLLAEYDQIIKQYYIDRTAGKLDFTWSQQMAKQAEQQTRPFIKKTLENKKLAIK